jgi:hypothetical protein
VKTHEKKLDIDDIDGAKARFISLKQTQFKDLLSHVQSEADTRAKIIDVILRDVLGWPETLIEREPHVIETGGYIDYILSTSRPFFVVEAKRQEHSYKLPELRTRRRYKVGGALKEDQQLYKDMAQARSYAINKGVAFCCLTNGHQFLFFRSQNDSGVSWNDHVVVVFRDHDEIEQHFSLFFHLLSYAAVSLGVVHGHLPITENYDEALRRFQKLDPAKQSLARTRERNSLFPALRTIISRVFQDISGEAASAEILENCYVETPRDSSYEKGLDGLMRRKPIEMGHAARPLTVTRKDAGQFQRSVEKQVTERASEPEVLLILGGIGVGKTTFLHRFRRVIATEDIEDNCLWAYVDFNKYSDTGELLLNWVVREAWASLAQDYSYLELDSFAVLKQAYHTEYEQLKRGRLAPLFAKSVEDFELAFGEALKEYEKETDQHFARMMRVAAQQTLRKPFLVFDNADQFSEKTQDEVFRLAQKFAKDIGCASVISLREESYWKNKDHGTLSAFHAVSYHVQPPKLRQVISRRFKFAEKLLAESDRDFVDSNERVVTAEELSEVLKRVSRSILANDSRYMELLEYLSPFEIRRPLQFLARFLVSGHTNMDSLLRSVRGTATPDLIIGFHEFLTAITLGDREFYSEATSDIVNLFAVDGRSDASNLNRLLVLGRILMGKRLTSPLGEGFVPVVSLISDCEAFGVMPDTTRSILTLMNTKRLVETEAQDRGSVASATFVRATAATQYYLDNLIYEFSYLDSMVIDTAIGDPDSYTRLEALTTELWSLQAKKGAVRLQRMQVRLERAKRFLYYLINNEFSNSTLKSHLDDLDPSVRRFFETAQGRFLRQAHEIERKATELFS